MSIVSDTSSRGRPFAGRIPFPPVPRAVALARGVGAGLVSLAGAALVLGCIWGLASAFQEDLPGPLETLPTFGRLVSDPFYSNGPNDKGIGLHLIASLQRVFLGFGLAAAAAVPLGILLGASSIFRRFLDPVVQVLRPVSPLAWFPIGLALLHSTAHAAIFAIFITSLWPTVLNTAHGVGSTPESHKNVSRVFQFNHWKYLTRIVLPHSLPHIITGLRLSMGISWLVIVAAEMLAGSDGIGFYVWDSYNAGSMEQILSAILLIGIVGLVLDRAFAFAATRFSYPEVA